MSAASLPRLIIERAAAHPDARLGTPDDQITIADALALAAGRAQALLDAGATPGRRIAVVAPTSTDYLVTWLAALLAGTPVALVNPNYPEPMVVQMLAPLQPDLVLGPDDVALARACGTADPTVVPGLAVDPFAPASYMHTSGTTGLPKFCVQSHDYFRRLALAYIDVLDLEPTDRVLAPLPMFHINPLGYGVTASLLRGADVLTVPRFSASGFWPLVVDHGITVMILHAPPVEILKRATTAHDAEGHRVRTMFFADGEFVRRFGIPEAVSGYGSTEAGGISHLHRWRAGDTIRDDASRYGGAAREDIDWRLDQDGIIELRERAPTALFGGYVTPEGIDPARDDDGWFTTGDRGRDEAGGDHLVFLERAAESIRVKGEYVPVPIVEDHLAALDGVRDHALWKRRGALVDDEVVLYVVADPLPLERLRARIAELPAFMRPVAVARVASLPRDDTVGKVRRRLLGEQAVLEWVELS